MEEFEASNFSEVFSIFDADKDGLISACDLRIALAKLGFEISSEDAANMIQVETHNGSDYLTYLEFFKIIQGKNFNNFAKKIDMRKSV
ncbi:Oidioi.mRNA.OKI2018_I69.chr1.g957.t1.cds [Oikopleura dioica]|uniref:Oidioi.mRNA.OKI2018_I69.chr1.g957.t1.cds n=1 Tax=Oikopleura dioica TaxID=34765 RepID=A0ABN7SQ90_OIKDI|nr:Oidioi.mRNA.OKI2018_I69.chr1.g957.t1.cds [Oikopleura dioica]